MLISDRAHNESASKPGLRQRHKERKHDRIARAGRALFVQKGFEKTTTRAIAKKAGVGVGTFFLYFKEKRDLLFHLFKDDLSEAGDQAFASLDQGAPLVDQLDHVFGCFLAYYARDPRLSRVFVKEIFFLEQGEHEEMAAFTAQFLGRVAGLVESAQARGEVDGSVVPGAAAMNAFALYFLGLVGWLTGGLPSREVTQELLKAQLELLMRGLVRRGPT